MKRLVFIMALSLMMSSCCSRANYETKDHVETSSSSSDSFETGTVQVSLFCF